MNKKFIAYAGEEFTIEWYYNENGNSQSLEYYNNLDPYQQDKLMYLFQVLADAGKIRSKEQFRFEEDKIFAFKPVPDRFLCFFYKDSKVIVTNAYEKKKDKMPPREKHKALKAKDDYINRCNKGSYYD